MGVPGSPWRLYVEPNTKVRLIGPPENTLVPPHPGPPTPAVLPRPAGAPHWPAWKHPGTAPSRHLNPCRSPTACRCASLARLETYPPYPLGSPTPFLNACQVRIWPPPTLHWLASKLTQPLPQRPHVKTPTRRRYFTTTLRRTNSSRGGTSRIETIAASTTPMCLGPRSCAPTR